MDEVNNGEHEVSTEDLSVPPEDFTWNESDVDQASGSYRATNKDEVFAGMIVKAVRSVAHNKKDPQKSSDNLQLDLTIRARDAANNPVGPQARYWVTIPVTNVKKPGHRPYDDDEAKYKMFDRARSFLRAVEGSEALPPFPKAVKEEGGTTKYIDPATGNTLTAMEKKQVIKSINSLTLEKLQKYYRDPDSLKNIGVYFGTYKKDGQQYSKISFLTNDAGARTIITEGFTD